MRAFRAAVCPDSPSIPNGTGKSFGRLEKKRKLGRMSGGDEWWQRARALWKPWRRVASCWSVKHDGISSDELLERLGVQVKLDNAGPLAQQSFPADLSRVVAVQEARGSEPPASVYRRGGADSAGTTEQKERIRQLINHSSGSILQQRIITYQLKEDRD